jgi:hypothetical protein
VVIWRRAQTVLLSAQDMPVAKIAGVTFTRADQVRNVIHSFNADGLDSFYPKYKGGRPKTFTLPERRGIKKIAKSKPVEHDLRYMFCERAQRAPGAGGAPIGAPVPCTGRRRPVRRRCRPRRPARAPPV